MRNKEYEERLEELESKLEKYDSFVVMLKALEYNGKLDNIENEVNKYQRILRNYKDGEITFTNIINNDIGCRNYVYLYINRNEYKIYDIKLHNPMFTYKDNDTILYVEDSILDKNTNNIFAVKRYVIDLEKQTFTEVYNSWSIN